MRASAEPFDQYDAIVIGAGHNGLAIGIYPARDGMRTLLVEKQSVPGGMAITDEALLPGFRHHAHANALSFQDLMSFPDVLNFSDLGLVTIVPEAQHGICFRDGRPPLVLYRADLTPLSLRSIQRYSYRDAKTFGLLKARADRLTGALARSFFGPPERTKLADYRDAIEAVYKDLGIVERLGAGTAKTLIDDLFQTPELRTLMYRLSMEFGSPLHEIGGDTSFLGLVMWLIGRRRLPQGGMSSVVDLMRDTFERAGGHILLGAPAIEIQTQGGCATGVVVEGVGEIAAPLIVSTLGVLPTYMDLLSGGGLTPLLEQELQLFESTPSPSIANQKFCLRESPNYKGSNMVPEINRCLQVFIGLDEPEDVLREADDIVLGIPPVPSGSIHINTLWDGHQAPGGFHSAGVDSTFPDIRALGLQIAERVQHSYAPAFVDTWQTYAPNLSDQNILAASFELTDGYNRKILLRPDGSQYRTHIDGVHLAGSSTYPGGGVHGACAYNAVRVIREDKTRRCAESGVA